MVPGILCHLLQMLPPRRTVLPRQGHVSRRIFRFPAQKLRQAKCRCRLFPSGSDPLPDRPFLLCHIPSTLSCQSMPGQSDGFRTKKFSETLFFFVQMCYYKNKKCF